MTTARELLQALWQCECYGWSETLGKEIETFLAQPEPEPVQCNPSDYCVARHIKLYAAQPDK